MNSSVTGVPAGTHFVCSLCGMSHDIDKHLYACSRCGPEGILEWMPPSPTSPGELTFTDSPGMWRYERLLPLRLDTPRPPLPVGGTPLVHGERLGNRLGLERVFIKNDALNPTGSLKDRASAAVLARALEIGASAVAVASTGNAGSSLAGLAASMGMPAIIFVPETAPRAKMLQALLYGAQVFAVRGSYDDAFDLCMQACEQFGWYNRSTAINPYTIEGKKTVSLEIFEQLGNLAPDVVCVPTGDGCILSGVAQGFRTLHRLGLIEGLPRLIAVQAQGSDAIARMVAGEEIDPEYRAGSVADSITVSVPRNGRMAARDVRESNGQAIRVTDEAILDAVAELASQTGIFAEPAAAASLAGLRVLVRQEQIESDVTVVLLVTGSGLKDLDSASRVASPPLRIDPSLDALKAALDRLPVDGIGTS